MPFCASLWYIKRIWQGLGGWGWGCREFGVEGSVLRVLRFGVWGFRV